MSARRIAALVFAVIFAWNLYNIKFIHGLFLFREAPHADARTWIVAAIEGAAIAYNLAALLLPEPKGKLFSTSYVIVIGLAFMFVGTVAIWV